MNLYSEPLVTRTRRLLLAAKVARIVAVVAAVIVGICAALWTAIVVILNGQPTIGAIIFAAGTAGVMALLGAAAITLTVLARRTQSSTRELLADRYPSTTVWGATA